MSYFVFFVQKKKKVKLNHTNCLNLHHKSDWTSIFPLFFFLPDPNPFPSFRKRRLSGRETSAGLLLGHLVLTLDTQKLKKVQRIVLAQEGTVDMGGGGVYANGQKTKKAHLQLNNQ